MTNVDDQQLPIYVGLDGSDIALEACRWAAHYADRGHVPITLVHALPDVQWYLGAAAIADENALFEELRTIGNRALSAAEALLHEIAPTVKVETVLTRNPIAAFIASVSESASLVVVGSSHRNVLSDLVLGGETIRICNSAKSPVLVWKPSKEAHTDTVLPVVVGVDYSDRSNQVVVTAFEYARALGAPLIANHLWQIGAAVGIGYSAVLVDWEGIRAEQTRRLHELMDPLCEKFADVKTTMTAIEGSPGRRLQELSAQAQLVVVGSRGHSKLVGAVLGSVSQNMIHHSDCSVLVVH